MTPRHSVREGVRLQEGRDQHLHHPAAVQGRGQDEDILQADQGRGVEQGLTWAQGLFTFTLDIRAVNKPSFHSALLPTGGFMNHCFIKLLPVSYDLCKQSSQFYIYLLWFNI